MDHTKHVSMDASSNEDRFRLIKWAAGIAVMVLLAVFWWFWPRDLQQEIRDLPIEERQAFVQRTIGTLRTTCARATGPDLAEYCREQAGLIANLAECDAACQDLVRRFPKTPTR